MKKKLGLFLAIGLTLAAMVAAGYLLAESRTMSMRTGMAGQSMMRQGMTHQGMTGQGMMHQGMTHQGMMGKDMKPEMMESHREMSDIVSRLSSDLESLASKTDLDAIHQTLQKDHSLVERLKAKMEDRQEMMGRMMQQMQDCPMMDSGGDSATPSSL